MINLMCSYYHHLYVEIKIFRFSSRQIKNIGHRKKKLPHDTNSDFFVKNIMKVCT